MKKQLVLLFVAGGFVANIVYAPAGEIFDPKKVQEKTQGSKTPEEMRRERAKIEEEVRRRAEETLRERTAWITAKDITQDQIIRKIQTTYKADGVNDPRKVETLLQELEQLKKQSVNQSQVKNLLDKKISELINRIVGNIYSNSAYAKKLDSAALEVVLRNLESIHQYQVELDRIIKNVAPEALLKASENQNSSMKEDIIKGLMRNDINKFNGNDISSLLNARIKLAKEKQGGATTDGALINDYMDTFTKASPEALRTALNDERTQKNIDEILDIIEIQRVHDHIKNQQIKSLFDALLRIDNPGANLVKAQIKMLDRIKDFSVFETTQDRASVIKTLNGLKEQIQKINESKQIAAAQELMVNLVDRFLKLNDQTPQELNAMVDILKTIPSENAANSERALILYLMGNKGFDQIIMTLLNNHMSRKEVPLSVKFNFLIQARNQALSRNLLLKKAIDTLILKNLSLVTSATDVPASLFKILNDKADFPASEVFRNLMKSELWKKPGEMAKLKEQMRSLLPGLTNVDILMSILQNPATPSDLKPAAINMLIRNANSVSDMLLTFKRIIIDASKEQLNALLSKLDRTQQINGEIMFDLYKTARSVERGLEFITMLANKARDEQWQFKKLAAIFPASFRFRLLDAIGKPAMNAAADKPSQYINNNLEWLEGLNKTFEEEDIAFTDELSRRLSMVQVDMVTDLINQYEKLNESQIIQLQSIAKSMEKRILSGDIDREMAEKALKVLRKVQILSVAAIKKEIEYKKAWSITKFIVDFINWITSSPRFSSVAQKIDQQNFINLLKDIRKNWAGLVTSTADSSQRAAVTDILENVDETIETLEKYQEEYADKKKAS